MKRFLSLFLTACLLVVLFTACSGGQEPSGNESSSSQSGNSTTYQYDPEVGLGGDTLGMVYASTYQDRLYDFPVTLINGTVGTKEFESWTNRFNFNFDIEDANKRPYEEFNLINFVKEFSISTEDFLESMKKEGEYSLFTEEEMLLICEGTPAQQIAAFTNPCAVAVGEKIYSAKWIAEHSAQEIETAGITSVQLEAKSAKWQKWITNKEKLSKLDASKKALKSAENK